MEQTGRRLAWIAIGISALALVVSLVSLGAGWRRQMVMVSAPPAAQGPWHERGGPPGFWRERPQPPEAPPAARGPWHERGEHGAFMVHRPWFVGLFALPFLLLGGLAKLLLWGLVFYLLFKLFRRGNNPSGGSGRGTPPPAPPAPPRPGPEPPPYTGETTSL